MPTRSRSGALESILPASLLVLLALGIGIWLVWDGLAVPLVTYGAYPDYWEHTAVLTEWMRNFAAPTNPHVVSTDLSSRFMPYFWVLTQLGRLLDLDAVQLMSISAVVNYCLILLGIQLFFRSYFRDAWAPLIGFIAIFMFWGIGWNWANLYQLRSFFYIGGYPSSFVFGLSLVSFWATLRLLRNEGSPIVLGASLAMLASLMLLCHPLTGVFGIVSCALLSLTEGRVALLLRMTALVALLAGSLLPEFWPYFSVWKLMLGQYGTGIEQWGSDTGLNVLDRFQSGEWQHLFYNPAVMVNMLGPVLLGVPVLVWLLLKRQHLFIVIGAIVMAIPYLANLFVAIPLAHRFLLFVVTYLQLALVWFALNLITECRTEPRPSYGRPALSLLVLFMVGTVAANFALLAAEYRGESLSPDNLQVRNKRALLPEGQNVIDVYQSLTAPLDDTSVVLTTAALGWPLPTVKGKVVSIYHENPLLLDQVTRYQATGDFFYRPIGEDQRAEIVTRYGVSHVLLSEGDANLNPNVSEWLSRFSKPVSTVGNYRMYELLDTVPRIIPKLEPAEPEPAEPAEETIVTEAPATEVSAGFDVNPDMSDEAGPTEQPAAEPDEAPASSFGAPIAPPIINIPAEEADETQAEMTDEPGLEEADSDAPMEQQPAQQLPAAPSDTAAEGGFGAPIAEPIINVPDISGAPAEAPGNGVE